MTNDTFDECIRLLAGKARSCGIVWDDTVLDVYAEALNQMDGECALRAVRECVFERPGLADVHELRRMATPLPSQAKHQVRDHSQPGHEMQQQGIPAYVLMRQGFMAYVRKEHGFLGSWDEWVALHREDMKDWDRMMRRLDAVARKDADESGDPFRWRPGEPLPLESDAEKARKRAAIDQLRRSL